MNSFSNGFHSEIVRQPRGWQRLFTPSSPKSRPDAPAATSEHATATLPTLAPPRKRKVPRNIFSSLRMRLVGTVFVAIAPPMCFVYYFHLEDWAGFLVGLVVGGRRATTLEGVGFLARP